MSTDLQRITDRHMVIAREILKGKTNQEAADAIVAQLLFLDSSDKDSDISMYINSPGGEISAMYSIYDTMNLISCDIKTVGLGTCASAASFILGSGKKGKRSVLPSTQIMIHELSGGIHGKAGDMRNHFKQTEYLYELMAKQYVKITGQKLSKIKLDMTRDFYLTATEAVEYGIVDSVTEGK